MLISADELEYFLMSGMSLQTISSGVRRDIVVEKKQVPPAPKGQGRPPIKPTKRPAAQREVVKARQAAHKPPDKKSGMDY